jgi:hypothetical protein
MMAARRVAMAAAAMVDVRVIAMAVLPAMALVVIATVVAAAVIPVAFGVPGGSVVLRMGLMSVAFMSMSAVAVRVVATAMILRTAMLLGDDIVGGVAMVMGLGVRRLRRHVIVCAAAVVVPAI